MSDEGPGRQQRRAESEEFDPLGLLYANSRNLRALLNGYRVVPSRASVLSMQGLALLLVGLASALQFIGPADGGVADMTSAIGGLLATITALLYTRYAQRTAKKSRAHLGDLYLTARAVAMAFRMTTDQSYGFAVRDYDHLIHDAIEVLEDSGSFESAQSLATLYGLGETADRSSAKFRDGRT